MAKLRCPVVAGHDDEGEVAAMHRRTAFEGKSPDGSSGLSLAAVRSQWIARRWGLSEKGFMGETAFVWDGRSGYAFAS